MPQGAQQPAMTISYVQTESCSKKRKINAFVMVWGGPQPPLLLKAACSQLSTSHVWELTAGLRPLSG